VLLGARARALSLSLGWCGMVVVLAAALNVLAMILWEVSHLGPVSTLQLADTLGNKTQN
jgi:hypothetical protein